MLGYLLYTSHVYGLCLLPKFLFSFDNFFYLSKEERIHGLCLRRRKIWQNPNKKKILRLSLFFLNSTSSIHLIFNHPKLLVIPSSTLLSTAHVPLSYKEIKANSKVLPWFPIKTRLLFAWWSIKIANGSKCNWCRTKMQYKIDKTVIRNAKWNDKK